MREKHWDCEPIVKSTGITPAYAGKTDSQPWEWWLLWDHPRVCGKNLRAQRFHLVVSGSPPRMREKRIVTVVQTLAPGITPAYAGKTFTSKMGNYTFRDHPRVCGKNQLPYSNFSFVKGSPPRMREKQRRYCKRWCWGGITPAYAGKTVFFEEQVRFDEDHPRVCGKNYMQGELDFSSAGSPPRMREKRPLMALGRELNRITPAYAGKTKSSLLNLVVVQDHPRVCGKNHFKSLISNLVAGSPPRMREKH